MQLTDSDNFLWHQNSCILPSCCSSLIRPNIVKNYLSEFWLKLLLHKLKKLAMKGIDKILSRLNIYFSKCIVLCTRKKPQGIFIYEKKSFTVQVQQVQKFKPECDGNSLNQIWHFCHLWFNIFFLHRLTKKGSIFLKVR